MAFAKLAFEIVIASSAWACSHFIESLPIEFVGFELPLVDELRVLQVPLPLHQHLRVEGPVVHGAVAVYADALVPDDVAVVKSGDYQLLILRIVDLADAVWSPVLPLPVVVRVFVNGHPLLIFNAPNHSHHQGIILSLEFG